MKTFIKIVSEFASSMAREAALSFAMYVLAKCASALLNRFNRHAYAAE